MKKLVCAIAFAIGSVAACGGKQDSIDGGTDATSDSPNGGDAAVCTYQDTRTTSTRSCTSVSDCAVVVRELSCCQEEEDGIRSDAVQQFNSTQTALTAACPACGCAAQPVDEKGLKGTSFSVSCDNGECTAHAQ